MTAKNQILRIRIDDINPDGNGIGRADDGKVVFVPLTAPGDVWDVRIIKETSGYLVGKAESLVSPSEHRVPVPCPCYNRCGSCSFLHLSEEYENRKKREIVKNAFLRIAKMDVPVEETRYRSMERYRNKVVYPLAYDGPDASFGYYARHSHVLVPHTDCPLQDKRFSEIAACFCGLADRMHVPLWNESSQSGILRHLAIRMNRSGSFAVTVVASKQFREATRIADDLRNSIPAVSSVFLNVNPRPDNVILGPETVLLSGFSSFEDALCGKRFLISPLSFYQIHADIAEEMYRTAAGLLSLREGGTLLDLYCGVGTIGLSLVSENQNLFGVEIVPDAVRDAAINAERNGRSGENTIFICGDASEGFRSCEEAFGTPDAIVVDPPRKGLSDEVLHAVIESGCEHVLYISCNPATLAGNCSVLCANGFSVQTVIPFNMFPRTGHVETVVLLRR